MYGYDADDDQDQQGPKPLRDALEKANKLNADLKAQLDQLQGKVKTQSVREILRELGVKPKVANLVPSTIEATPEGLAAWVKDYEDVFGTSIRTEEKPDAQEAQAAPPTEVARPNVDEDTVNALSRIQSAAASAGTTTADAEQQAIAWLQAAKAASNNSDQFFSILSGETKLNP